MIISLYKNYYVIVLIMILYSWDINHLFFPMGNGLVVWTFFDLENMWLQQVYKQHEFPRYIRKKCLRC